MKYKGILTAAAGLAFLVLQASARDVVIVAHRGSSAAAPENTLAAFDLGFAEGADAVECDLRTSYDGEIVMVHDGTLDRTTDGTGPVGDFTLAELKSLDAGSWRPEYIPTFVGERIPTLAETLAAAEGRGRVLLDIKTASPSTVAARVAAGDLPESEILVLTWNATQQSAFAAALPGAVILRTPWTQPATWSDSYFVADRNRGGDGYGLSHSSVTRSFVDDAHRHGMLVYAFTVNSPSAAQRLVDLGIDGLITDFPLTIRNSVDFDPSLQVRTLVLDDSGNMRLTWRSIAGRSYHVETSDDLSQPWELIAGSETTATGILSTFETSSPPTGPAGFYRVVESE